MKNPQVVAVNGASGSLGLGVAAKAVQQGAIVHATMRNPVKRGTARCCGLQWARQFTQLKTPADPDGKLLQAKVVNEMLGGLE